MTGRTERIGRAIAHVEKLVAAGHDVASFAAELTTLLRRSVPHRAACVLTTDPATGLLTGTHKFGDLTAQSDLDVPWARLEYGTDDPTRLELIARHRMPAMATSQLPGGSEDSIRMRELLGPAGYGDSPRSTAPAVMSPSSSTTPVPPRSSRSSRWRST